MHSEEYVCHPSNTVQHATPLPIKVTCIVVQAWKVLQKLAPSLHVPGHTCMYVYVLSLCAACHSPDMVIVRICMWDSPNEEFLVRLVHSDLLRHVHGQQSVTVVNRKVTKVLKSNRTLLLETGSLGIHPNYRKEGKKWIITEWQNTRWIDCIGIIHTKLRTPY